MCQQLYNCNHILNVHKINTAYTKYILIGRVKYFKSRPVELMHLPINVNFCFTLQRRHKMTLNQFNVHSI